MRCVHRQQHAKADAGRRQEEKQGWHKQVVLSLSLRPYCHLHDAVFVANAFKIFSQVVFYFFDIFVRIRAYDCVGIDIIWHRFHLATAAGLFGFRLLKYLETDDC